MDSLYLACKSGPASLWKSEVGHLFYQQYLWHEQERIMFVCLDPCTWQGREYDNHSTPLSEITLPKLSTDQWCETALSWAAREILFVAKHTGGFCWWQTDTTDYCVKNIAWKNGRGDLLVNLAKSCRKYGLNLGIYVYPGDESWGAGIGSGGKTRDPDKQEAYNKVFRRQWQEALETASKYTHVSEVWFDGSCVIEVGDIIKQYAPHAVVFQGPYDYGVSGNMRSLKRFYSLALRMTLKWLNRRSQRKSFNRGSFRAYLKHYPLPQPRIVHNLYTLSPVV